MALPAELQAEVDGGRPFLYDWDLGPLGVLPIAHPDLALAQRSVREAIEHDVRAALAAAGPHARALDLACNEGWWSHRLVEWGAASVLAVEAREDNARRARLLRDARGIPASAIDVETADATALDPGALGTFDVVLCLGLLYHLEDPIGTLRRARCLCRGLLCVETQVTRSPGPVRHAWGSTDDAAETAVGTFALRWERDPDFPLASVGGGVSLIPDRDALLLSLGAAGFTDVRIAEPARDHASGFVSGDRVVALAR